MDHLRFERLKPLDLPPLAHGPLVSVLVANYNYASYLAEALESVLNQTYSNLEIIVCDDGSTDDSCQIVERYARQDARVRLIRKPNGGVSSALNAAHLQAKGDLVALLDADDAWFPDRLDCVVRKFVDAPEVGFVTHCMRIVDGSGRTLARRTPTGAPSEGWLCQRLLSGSPMTSVAASALTFRKPVAEVIFPLPEAFRQCADALLRNRAMLLTPAGAVDNVLALYRIHLNNLTGFPMVLSLKDIDAHIDTQDRIYKDTLDFARRFHGIHPDEQKDIDWPGRRSWKLSRALMNGERLPPEEISKSKKGIARWGWATLFLLPRWLAKRIYLSWRKGGILYRLGLLVHP